MTNGRADAATTVDDRPTVAPAPGGSDEYEEPAVGLGEFFRRLYAVTYSKTVGVVIILLFALLALAGVIFAQATPETWADSAARAGFVAEMRAKYGGFTPILGGLGFFHVFSSIPFFVVTIALAVSITGCTSHRLPQLLTQWRHPRIHVSPRFYTAARYQATVPTHTSAPEGLAAAAEALKKARYRVIEADDDSLYADRFAWGGLGTVASHLSFLVILGAFLITGLASYSTVLRVPIGGEAVPVGDSTFSIAVADYNESTDPATGTVIDYVSDLILYDGEAQVARHDVRVNSPLTHAGWLFYQYMPPVQGTVMRVTTADGVTLFDGGLEMDYVSNDGTLDVGLIRIEERGLTIQVEAPVSGQAGVTNSLGVAPGQVAVLLFLDDQDTPANMSDIGTTSTIDPGTSYTYLDLTVDFRGESRLVGIKARTDPGTVFVWIGGILLVAGMTVTFTCRHRRLWVRAEDGRLLLASADKEDSGARQHFTELAEQASTWPETRS